MESLSVTAALLCLLAHARPAFGDDTVPLQPLRLEPTTVAALGVGMEACPSAFVLDTGRVLAVCRPAREHQRDRGLRPLLLRRDGDRLTTVFRGKSVGDAYTVTLAAFGGTHANRIVVLAEAAAEFSYGIGVYVVDGVTMAYAGEMDVAIAGEDNAESAVPSVRIEQRDTGLCVSFDRDVVRVARDGTYQRVPREKAGYRYAHGRFLPVPCADDPP